MPLKKKRARKKIAKKKKVVKKKVIKRKVTKKRVLKKKPTKKVAVKKAKAKEKILGTVTHYFPKVRAAVIKLKAPLGIGDVVKIKGHTTDFTQNVTSIQINHVSVNQAKRGEEIGLLVDSRVRQNDMVYKA